MSEKIIAYKAMDKNMQCRGKQYEVGKTYHEDKADCCHAGMHACENPLDVLHYYPLKDSPRFFEVECGGNVDKSGDYSTAGTSGYCSTAGTSGNRSTAGTSGDYSTAAATGAYCSAKADGKDSIAVVNGVCGKARGALGCYLVLTEYDDDGNMLWAKLAKVDGFAIKENVYYTLKNGEFVEVKP